MLGHLYCTKCLHATAQDRWRLSLYKHGVCPKCGCSGYRNTLEWGYIATANGYPSQPVDGQKYPVHPQLF